MEPSSLRSAQVHIRQDGSTQIGSHQIGFGGVNIAEIRTREICAGKIRAR